MLDSIIQSFLADGEISLLSLAVVYFAGVLGSLSPCVYPLLPIVAGITGAGSSDGRNPGKSALLALSYATGLAIIYGGLGLAAALSGTLFGSVQTNPYLNIVFANLLLVMGAWMLGWIRLPLPAIGSGISQNQRVSVSRSFVYGSLSGLVMAPCTVPVLGMLLIWVSAGGSIFMGAMLLVVFAFGLSSLLIAVGFASGVLTRLPKPGKWMKWIPVGFAFLLLVAAEYYMVEAGKLLF